jgi:hypothetical protein
MANLTKLLNKCRNNPQGFRYAELCKICDHFFGSPRQSSGSHRVYRTPWEGEPYVNIQDKKGMAKPYQVRQVLNAIEKLEELEANE